MSDETFTLDELREAFEAAAHDMDALALEVRNALRRIERQAHACQIARHSTESMHQREVLRGKETAYRDAARILRMVVPRDEG